MERSLPVPMPVLVRKLLQLDRRSWQDLLAAQAALLSAQWKLRTRPIGEFAIRAPLGRADASGDAERARAIAVAVTRAARHGLFRPYCLVRAVALREMLVANGVQGSSIRIGVRREQGAFQAHAWVRWGEVILGDVPEHVASFTEVDDLRVVSRR